jgi:tetratricopeptide (TPR) repeat protein
MSELRGREVHLEANGFPKLLRRLVSELAVGRLEITQRGIARRLWLEAGQVCAVVSDRDEDKLGNWLVAKGMLQSHQMAVALLRQPEGVRFGTFLLMQKLLDFEQLTAELAGLATRIVSDQLFDPGSYHFVQGETLDRDAASLQVTTATLLVAAVRAVEDLSRLETLVSPEHYLWSAQDALLQHQRVQLLPQEGYLLSRVDGQTTVAMLQRLVPLPREATTRALAGLVVARLVEVHHEPMPRQDAPPEPIRQPHREQAGERQVPAHTAPPPGAGRPVQAVPTTSFRVEPVSLPASPVAPSHLSWAVAPGPPQGGPAAPSVPVQEVSWLPMPAAPSLASLDDGEPAQEQLSFSEAEEKEHAEVLRLAASCRRMDPLARLGLTFGADPEVIKLRFGDLVRRFHPDRAAEPHLRMLRRELAEISAALLEGYEQALTAASSTATGEPAGREPPLPLRRVQPDATVVRPAPRLPDAYTDEEKRKAIHDKINDARRLMRQGDANQAAELLDQAERLGPDPKTLLYMARIEFHNPMWVQRGLDHLKHAVSKDPGFTEGWLELANYWGTRGQLDKQRQCLERVLAYDPRNEDARAALAAVMGAMRAHWS